MSLRIAMLTTFYPPHHFGGDAVGVRRLAHALVRRGHRVEVIHDVDAFELLNKGPVPEPIEEPKGLVTHPLRSRLGAVSTLLTQQLGRPIVHGRRIRDILARGDFDVTHFHNVSLVGGPGILPYGQGVKLYTAHEHWLVCPTHVLWRHNREVCDQRQCLRCVLRHRRPPQLWRYTGLLDRAARHVDVFLSPSRWSADKHRSYGFAPPMEVMPYFLPDLEPDAEASVSSGAPPSEQPYFLFVGRLEKIKGLQDVIPLFDDDAPAPLWIVGDGNYRGELERLAAGHRMVRFLGARQPAELRELYAGAIALIVPSLCYETFGIIVLEAYHERVPVVARSIGPLPQIVESSGGGLLFESSDELMRHLRTLAAEPELRARLGAAGQRALTERWIESVVVEQYLDIIDRVARERGLDDVRERLRRSRTVAT